jgi:hypothetical protein
MAARKLKALAFNCSLKSAGARETSSTKVLLKQLRQWRSLSATKMARITRRPNCFRRYWKSASPFRPGRDLLGRRGDGKQIVQGFVQNTEAGGRLDSDVGLERIHLARLLKARKYPGL